MTARSSSTFSEIAEAYADPGRRRNAESRLQARFGPAAVARAAEAWAKHLARNGGSAEEWEKALADAFSEPETPHSSPKGPMDLLPPAVSQLRSGETFSQRPGESWGTFQARVALAQLEEAQRAHSFQARSEEPLHGPAASAWNHASARLDLERARVETFQAHSGRHGPATTADALALARRDFDVAAARVSPETREAFENRWSRIRNAATVESFVAQVPRPVPVGGRHETFQARGERRCGCSPWETCGSGAC